MSAPANWWPSHEAPRELMGPRGLWYVRCWGCGTSFIPGAWLGMHAKQREIEIALARAAA